MTEKEKMLAGQMYRPSDDELQRDLWRTGGGWLGSTAQSVSLHLRSLLCYEAAWLSRDGLSGTSAVPLRLWLQHPPRQRRVPQLQLRDTRQADRSIFGSALRTTRAIRRNGSRAFNLVPVVIGEEA